MKKIASISYLSLYLLFSTSVAYAQCPVCTVGVIAGLGLSRWLGIDDTISGVWIGALLVTMIAWTLRWFKKKKFSFWGIAPVTSIVYYGMVILPLYWKDIIGHPFNRLWGIDKLIVGISFGSIIFVIAILIYEIMKKKNGHPHFSFEKVVLPISSLIILSGIFYFITRH
jgi:hypothetical protein